LTGLKSAKVQERIDGEILVDIVNHRLDDLRRFRDEVLRYAGRGN